MDWTVINAALILLASIVVLAVIAIVVRRFATNRGLVHGLPIRIIARQPIAPKASVVIVDIGDKRFLLGVTEQNVSLLGSFPITQPAQQPSSTPTAVTPPPQAIKMPRPTPAPAELSFRAYLSSMFQRSTKGQQ